MKTLAKIAAALLIWCALVTPALALTLPQFFQNLGAGNSTVSTLDQFKATSTPFSAITTRTHGNNLYFPYSTATSSRIYATVFCINNSTPDCITEWPAGGGSGNWATTSTNYFINASTTIAHPGNASYGDVIGWNGSTWIPFSTSTLGLPLFSNLFGKAWEINGSGLLAPTSSVSLAVAGTATSTFARAVQAPCFTINGTTCITTGGGSGTVTSVDATVPTGLTVSGVPITTDGSIDIALDTGYVIPLTASTTEWNQAYASTTALSNSYIRGLLSGTSPVTYNSTSGAIGLGTVGFANGGTGNTATFASGTIAMSDGTKLYPFATSSFNLNYIATLGPTGQAQVGPNVSIASSTDGTDFTITGSSNTVTFNLPTASATNRGALSAADWSTFNGKQAAGNYITALTGDVTASGPGSAAATLATVNGNVGSFTNASITVNGKGLITAASSGTAPVFDEKWATSSADSAAILPNGASKVAIGTTTPFSKLSVHSIPTDNSINLFTVATSTLTSTTTAFRIDRLGDITIGAGGTVGSSNTASGWGVDSVNSITGDSSGTLIITTRNTTASAEGVRYSVRTAGGATLPAVSMQNSTANVGIGTTTPWANLSVHGNHYGFGTNPLFAIATSTLTSTTTVFMADYLGNIGIGTTSPSQRLSVQGNGIFSGNLTFAGATATGTVDFSSATVREHRYPSFSWPAGSSNATTTTATTTIPLGTAFVANTWNSAECWSGSGTVGYRVTDGTNAMNFRQATTTASRFALSTNNTFTASEKRFIEVGPMTGSYLSCSFDYTENL